MMALLNLPPHSGLNKMYIVYDFTQISDAVLMVMYDKKSGTREEAFINYQHGGWIVDNCCNYSAIEAWYNNNNDMQKIFFQHDKIIKHRLTQQPQLLPDHALLLLNACS